ncbi:LysR family transcriptional regulator [Eggerthella sinensis]|uniref:LysR family transcriptional regulator n=1 Tax=Eggerthella sinensis TaxID=242230 RepID=UPI00131409AD|nr:LysR family transcriptional regulator [Eggerthella sinensis]MCB7038343.1 LysR family transcriptional regulator [Eggerthella sinensis]
MNISQLEYFVTTVQYGSFTMAAKELFVTPQAVSKSVGDLERELHVQLCEKSGRCVKPTEFGRMFAARASEALSCLVDLETLAKHQERFESDEGRISLAVACSPCRGNVIHASDFDGFAKSNPRITLTTTYTSSGACLGAVEEGVVDAAVMVGRTSKPGISSVKLLAYPLHVAMAASHPLASNATIRVTDLEGVPLAAPEDLRYCRSVITDHLRARNVEPHYVSLEPFVDRHRAFLHGERGVVFMVPDPAIDVLYPSVVLRPVHQDDFMSIPLCLAYADGVENPVLPHVERYLLATAARIRRELR